MPRQETNPNLPPSTNAIPNPYPNPPPNQAARVVDNVKKAATEEKRRRWSGGLTLTLSPTLTQTLALSPALALSPTLTLTLTRWSGGYSEPTRDGEPPAYGTRDSEPDVGARPLTLTLTLTLPNP